MVDYPLEVVRQKISAASEQRGLLEDALRCYEKINLPYRAIEQLGTEAK